MWQYHLIWSHPVHWLTSLNTCFHANIRHHSDRVIKLCEFFRSSPEITILYIPFFQHYIILLAHKKGYPFTVFFSRTLFGMTVQPYEDGLTSCWKSLSECTCSLTVVSLKLEPRAQIAGTTLKNEEGVNGRIKELMAKISQYLSTSKSGGYTRKTHMKYEFKKIHLRHWFRHTCMMIYGYTSIIHEKMLSKSCHIQHF